MIKTILWDFDGVVLDSMKIKGDGFIELFSDYDEKYLKEIEKYHYAHGGVSRFEKIRYFFNQILQKDISEDYILTLADRFADIIEIKVYDEKNLIEETVSFIKENYKKYSFHIVSGAEHNELNKLCDYFHLSVYFKSIDGSPTNKDILIENIMQKYNYIKDETILIGDAITDYNAAMKNEIGFYGYNNPVLKKFSYINSFREFKI